jgi:SapC
MNRTVPLDNVAHRDLRVRTGYAAEFGDAVNTALVFPTEFALVQREYPILFRREPGGQLQAMALLGLDSGENLFLENGRWNARYVPAVLQRGPFLIGFREWESGGEAVREPTIHVNLDSPRLGTSEGESIFLKHGGNSPYLERASRALQTIYNGSSMLAPMFAAFEAAQLIDEMQIEVELDDRVKYELPGFLTISAERLAQLNAARLERLHKAGFLQLAVLAAASVSNMYWLMELKNRRRVAER